ncbi:uridine-cytidine kinase-like 1 [Indicator indicator]|nr:uridine-cytidine kinase-like 1 [Indicator indicator]
MLAAPGTGAPLETAAEGGMGEGDMVGTLQGHARPGCLGPQGAALEPVGPEKSLGGSTGSAGGRSGLCWVLLLTCTGRRIGYTGLLCDGPGKFTVDGFYPHSREAFAAVSPQRLLQKLWKHGLEEQIARSVYAGHGGAGGDPVTREPVTQGQASVCHTPAEAGGVRGGSGAGAAGSRVRPRPVPAARAARPDRSSPWRHGEMAAAGTAGPEPPGALGSLLSRLPLTPRRRTASQCKPEPPLLRTSKRTIYTAGRPPWYSETGAPVDEAFVIGLCGGSASGKTTVATRIIEALDVPWVVLLSMDSFYKVLDEGQQALAARSDYNFDHPDAFDFELLVSVLRKLKKGKSVKVPVYDFTTHSRRREWKTVYGANVIVFEGILAFANKELLKLLDMKVFVDTDSDIRLVRRLQRDIMERGRDIVGVIKQYNKFVKPAFEQYIEPTVQVADIVVPRGGENFVALDLIVQHVHSQLEKREITVRAALASAHQGQPLPKTLSVLENTPQVRGMHTIIRNKDTTRDEFIFYSKRLMRLLIEHALSFLPLKSVTVETPQGTMYEGKRFHRQRITGVSILRAGETMEQALTAVCKDIRLGKILIQTNHDTGEPELHYLRLPKEISEDYVILMDSTVSTGAAAMMAVRVLLDHDVQEDRIFLLSLLMAEMGVHSVAYAFPRVRIITTAVDKRINEEFHIIPGIGNFGDRYFGTDGPSAWCESDGMDC